MAKSVFIATNSPGVPTKEQGIDFDSPISSGILKRRSKTIYVVLDPKSTLRN